MRNRYAIAACAIVVTAAVGFPEKAFAFCGTVTASGQGETRQQAITATNNKGLRETKKLDRNYKGRVKYQPAKLNCKEGQFTWNCRITQQFCTN